jgi:hypothetical protein
MDHSLIVGHRNGANCSKNRFMMPMFLPDVFVSISQINANDLQGVPWFHLNYLGFAGKRFFASFRLIHSTGQ